MRYNSVTVLGKSIKERLLGRLTGACMSSFIGLVFISLGIIVSIIYDWQSVSDDLILCNILAYLIGGILIAVGISLFIAFFFGRNLLLKEIEAEEKQLTENK